MTIDFYNNNGEAKHILLKAVRDNKDRVSFTFFREGFNRKCRITLDLGKYIIQAVVPFVSGDSYIIFRIYKRKMFGLYKSYLGSVPVKQTYVESLEALVYNYIDAKVEELKKAINEAEEAKQRKVDVEFIDYLKKNCSTSE